MLDDLRPYPEYRDSGVPWLGQIPVHWDVRQLRHIGRFSKTIGGTKEDNIDTGVPCVRYGDLYTTHQYFIKVNKSFIAAERACDYSTIAHGDVLFAASGETIADIGKSAVNLMTSGVRCGGDMILLRPHVAINHAFLGYAADSPSATGQKALMGRGTTVKHIYTDQLKYLAIALPPLSEQPRIVRFLDAHDQKVAGFTRNRRRLIELLSEQKQAIITQAVTRGLDPCVPIKTSGAAWISEVPAHWQVRQLRRLVSFITSGSRGWASYYSDEGDIFLQSGNLGRDMTLNLSNVQHVRPPDGAEGERTRVQFNDVLICITGALTGNVVLVDKELNAPAFVNQHVALVRLKGESVLPRYVVFCLYSDIGRAQFKAGEYGGTKQGLGLDDVLSAVIPVPSLSEQTAICAELSRSLARLTLVSKNAERQISLAREYQLRLLSDVVTGKVDVRHSAPDQVDADLEEIAALVEDDDVEDTLAGSDDLELAGDEES